VFSGSGGIICTRFDYSIGYGLGLRCFAAEGRNRQNLDQKPVMEVACAGRESVACRHPMDTC
jgi:hypothetical protein